MNIILNAQEIHTVLHALIQARYELATSHGLNVDDNPDINNAVRLDFNNSINLIDDAVNTLGIFEYNRTVLRP